MGRNRRDPRFAFETIWDVLVQKGHGWCGGGARSRGRGWGRVREHKEKRKLSVGECFQSEKGRKVIREPQAPSAQPLRIKPKGD